MRRTENPPYYIGAYEIAVRNGFRGTREEFGLLLGRGAAAAESAEAAAAYADRAAQEAQASAETAEAARSAAEAAEENAGEAAAAADLEAQEAQASAETAEAAARMAEGWATGESSGTPSETNNAKYYAETAGGFVARPFSAETVYHETDLAIYGGKLYVFTRDHSGAWSESDAAELVLGDYVQDLDGEIEEWGRQLAEEFDEQESYGAGELVLRGGLLYVFTQDHSGEWTGLDVQRTTTAAAIAGHYVTAGRKSGTTLGTAATAEGRRTTASGDYAHAEGDLTTASGELTHAEGYKTTASGSQSHAEGHESTASANYAHAEGMTTTAGGFASHAEGRETEASSSEAHAEGYKTTASGDYAHAEGRQTTASGMYSHAEGRDTVASGGGSHAEGDGTTANHKSQHVFGENNVPDASNAGVNSRGTYVEIVGNGTGSNAQSNARTLDWDGNEVLAGKLTLGAGPANAMDAATKQYVDDHSGGGGTYTAGDGIVIEDGEISLPTVFYDYLLRETYEAPVLTLTMSGVGGAHEIGSPVTVTGFTHKETNIANIKPDTLKFYRGSTVLETVTPSEQNAAVTLAESITEPGTSTGSVTYKLQCTDTLNQPQSKSVTATWYRYVYSQIGDPEVKPTTAASCVKQADLSTFASNGATFNYTVGSCVWLLTTNQNAEIQTEVMPGSWGGVTTYQGGSVTFTQANGVEATYFAYRTDWFRSAGSAKYRIT